MSKLDVSKMKNIISTSTDYEEIKKIKIDQLIPFSNHPFKAYPENKMNEMVASVKRNGILNPLIVRPMEKNRYEIIAGHNRLEAAKQAKLSEVPAIVRVLDDETAAILMVDTNFNQREKILPSEKAYAYKIKLEAIKRKAGRPAKNARQPVRYLESAELIGEEMGESGRQIQRYIRLTSLIPELMDKVDSNRLSFISAVDLSYLSQEEQTWLNDIITIHQIKPNKPQANQLKLLSQAKGLNKKNIQEIIMGAKEQNFSDWNATNKFKALLPKELQKQITVKQANQILEEAMEYWRAQHEHEYQ